MTQNEFNVVLEKTNIKMCRCPGTQEERITPETALTA